MDKGTVLIWGSYNHGNYGDDIMAIIFHDYIKSLGFEPLVFNLDPFLADKFNIQTSDHLKELVAQSDYCIIGGGGMLVSENIVRIIFRKNTLDFELGFKNLSKELSAKGIKAYAFSIGGDGKQTSRSLPFFRRRFFKESVEYATVRLKTDLRYLQDQNVSCDYIPDILLSLREVMGERTITKSNKKRIGINLIDKDSKKLIGELDRYKAVDNIEFFFINSHLPQHDFKYETVAPEGLSFNNYQYEDPVTMLDFLASLDLLISSKLHLGVSALSYGVPFCSYNGKAKTKTFLKGINSEFAIFNDNKIQEIVDIIDNPDDFKNKYDWKLLETEATESLKHFESLKSVLVK